MEKQLFYYDRQKAFLQICGGIAIILAGVFIVKSFFIFALFIIGGSFIYFGSKSVSGDPQVIISDEGLFIGFKFKKTISWNRIERAEVKKKEVDFRSLKFLELTIRINSNGPSNIMKREFIIEHLDVDSEHLLKLIKERLK